MLKKITLLLALVLLTASIGYAQWTNMGSFPNGDAIWKAQCHALAVDKDGKIWAGKYSNVAGLIDPKTGKALRAACYPIYIFNQDGTQASFSPIFQVMGDTMYNTSQRGMRTNIDGNILLVIGATAPNGAMMFLIDYKTGLGLKQVYLAPNAAGASSAPCVAADGTIFVAPVSPGAFPLSMYDQDFNLLGTAIQTTVGFSRSFEVSKDGNTLYWAGYTNGTVYIYTRPDAFSGFTLKDSMMTGVHAESMTWHPKTGNLWISGGSSNDKPTGPYSTGSWYAWDFAQKKVVDSLRLTFTTPATPDERPRGLAFSLDGNIAYIAQFGTSNWMVQKLVKTGSGVKQLDELPVGYDLSQNYPNPFNPTTNIKFSIPGSGFVSLKVYNTLGQEVATLLNEYKNAGTYQVDFNASKLSSGMYTYTLTSGNYRISKKMMLLK